MMDFDILLEAERRGILPEEKKPLLEEARRRGLVPATGPTIAAAENLPNEDGTYGSPPPDMYFDEKYQQWRSKENIKNQLRQREDNGKGRTGLDAFSSGAAQGVTLGGADEAYAALTGGSPEAVRAVMEYDRETHPGASIAGEIGGAVSIPLGGPVKGATTAARIGNAARAGGRMGAIYGFNTGEGGAKNRIRSMASGAAFGAGAGGTLGAGGEAVRKLLEKNMQRSAINKAAQGAPTSQQLRAEGQRLYDEVDRAGVQIKPQAFDAAREKMRTTLRGEGLDELPGPGSLTPKSARVMQIADEMSGAMAQEPTAALPFSSLDQLRRHAGTAASNAAPDAKTDRALGAETIGLLDDFVKNLGPDDVAAGDVAALNTALPKARDVWARMSRSQLVDDAIDAGNENYLSGGASGVRNQFARILRSPKLSRGFSDAERKAMQNVVNGSLPEVILNYLGSGLGMMGQIGAGAGLGAVGGPFGAVAGTVLGSVAAAGSRKASQALTNRKAEIARALIAKGQAPKLPQIDMNRAKILEAIMTRGAVAGQN